MLLSETDLSDPEKFKCCWDRGMYKESCHIPLAGKEVITQFGGRCLDSKNGGFVNVQREYGSIQQLIEHVKKVGSIDFWCPNCEMANRLQIVRRGSTDFDLSKSP